jgi:ribonuclease R
VDCAQILACLKRRSEALSVPEIARQCDLESDLEPAVRRQLEFLQMRGVVFSHRRGRWTLHSRVKTVIGRFSSPRGTFGFVIPEDGAGGDIHVPPRKLGGARHGDTVLARVMDRARAGRGGSGEVIAVVRRRSPMLAGLFYGDERGGVLAPRDPRIAEEIVIDAAGARALEGTAARGPVAAWAEVTSPQSAGQPARGRLIEVLGSPEDPGVDRAVIGKMFDLPGRFPPEAETEARALAVAVRAADVSGREDYTGSPVITVDPEGARDHDDAVGLLPSPEGSGAPFRLAVHIADVAHYVPGGGAVDAEARRRGTSVYFPGYCIPMLPEVLSSGACSLLPGELRLTHSVVMDFDAQGRRTSFHFADGAIRASALLTYEQAAATLRDGSGDAHSRMLREMEQLCRLLRSHRMKRGSLDLDLPETEVIVDESGRPVDVRPAAHTIAHEMIEEFMLAANETVAEFLHKKMKVSLYRIHEDPDPAGLDEVEEALGKMGFPVRRTRGSTSTRMKALLARFKDRPEGPAVAMMILRSLKLARYSHEAIGHFGLAAPLYTHFTSPIRRYPDLAVHRILREARSAGDESGRLEGAAPDAGERLAALALECSRLERRAEEAERAVTDWKKALYMKDRIGRELHGRVTGMTASNLFVTLEGLGVDGIVPLARSAQGNGPRLGDLLRVRVDSVDVFRGKVFLRALSTG